jgi:hypothetical protein
MAADALEVALEGDDAALRILNDAVMASGPISESYLLGRHEETREALRDLGPGIREPHRWPQAWGTALNRFSSADVPARC